MKPSDSANRRVVMTKTNCSTAGGVGQWSPPASWSRAWRSTGSSASRDSVAPFGEPGRFAISVAPRPDDAARQRGHRRRRDAGRPHQLGQPGRLAVDHAPRGGRRHVGRRQAGAAGREDEPVPGVGQARQQRRDLASSSATTIGSGSTSKPAARQRRDERRAGRVLPLPRRGSVRAGDDDRLVRRRPRPRHRAAKSPDRPPDFSSSSTRLDDDVALERLGHVVQRERGDRCGGQRLHLDAGAGGGARPRHGSRRCRQPRRAVELDVDPVERQRMAERDELGGALCGADPGQARGDERVALRTARVDERGEHVGPHAHGRRGHRPARGHRLRRRRRPCAARRRRRGGSASSVAAAARPTIAS